MRQVQHGSGKGLLLDAATELFRRNGFVATTVDDICAQAGVTKGAFFHYFPTKEALADACLEQWDRRSVAMEAGAAFQKVTDPIDRVFAYIDFYIVLFDNPQLVKSCLAGTTAQEVSESHDTLRQAANVCFANAEKRFKSLLDAACQRNGARLNTQSLAELWMATIQGSLVLCKASRDESVIRKNLTHFKVYLRSLLTGATTDRM